MSRIRREFDLDCWILSLCLLMALLPGGCGVGSDGPRRLPVSGHVEREGVAVEEASINFLPADGTTGPSAVTGITDGEYKFTGQNGPTAGKYRVLIQLPPPKRNRKQDAETGIRAPASTEKTSWEFKGVEIPADGPFETDFTLDR